MGYSTIFITSTKDAIFVFDKFGWLLNLHSKLFRIITDMVR
jgi:hypothetical protein